MTWSFFVVLKLIEASSHLRTLLKTGFRTRSERSPPFVVSVMIDIESR